MLRSLLLLVLFTSSALALSGDLDPSFGTGGKVLTNVRGTYDVGGTIAILDDGKILLAGGEGSVLVRYLPSGALDTTFGSGGKIFSGDSSGGLFAMKLQRDGTIATAGVAGFPGNVRVTRFSPSGSQLSDSFLDFGADDLAVAMALDSNDRIVVAGYSGVNDPANIIVARFTAAGSPDPTFGDGGKVSTDISGFEDAGQAVSVLPDGKILVAGYTRSASLNPRDFVLVRYEQNGNLDQSFGTGGKLIAPISTLDDAAYAMAIQPDGKILVGGRSHVGNHYHVTLARFHADGTLDNTFGTAGKVVTETGSFRSSVATELLLQSDGKILVAATLDEFQEDFLVLRYHPNGTLDSSFGAGGRVQTLFGGSREIPNSLALQRDGKIVVSGYSYQSLTGYDFALARYLGDGPSGGNLSINPPSPAQANSPLTATFSNWSAVTLPLTYELRAGATIIVPASENPAPQFQLAAGTYQLRGRIYDAAGNFSETPSISFQTAEGPVATTQHAVEVMTYSAKLTGTVDANSLSTQVSWLYGTDLPLTSETPAQTVGGANPVPVSRAITGLQPGTKYFFRTRAVNSIGESLGDVVNFTTASADPVHTILHATRQPVPSAGPTGSAGVPEGPLWATFGEPSLLGTGNSLGFSATMRMGTRTVQGVFSGPLQTPSLKVKVGDPATDPNGVTVGGVAFARFKSPVFADADRWAVLATVAGSAITPRNDTGIWAGEPGGLIREVAREGNVAPGTFGALFKSFTAVLRHDAAFVAFTAKLKGSGISPQNDDGLWTWTPAGGAVLHTREGANNLSALPGLPIKRLQVLELVPGVPGHGQHDLQFFGGLVTATNGEQAIVNLSRTGVQSHARSGVPLPGGITALRFGQPCWLPGANSYTALATLLPDGASVTPANAPAILRDGFVLAQKGAPVPGINGAVYRAFGNPVADYARNGEACTVFTTHLSGAGVTGGNDQAVVAAFENADAPELIAREGAEPPGTPGAKWSRFPSVSVLSGRGALFTADYTLKDPTQPPGSGLWAEDSSGALQLLLRAGSVIGGKKVRSLTVLSHVLGSPAQRRSSVQGARTLRAASVISRVTFTDGTTALVTTAVP